MLEMLAYTLVAVLLYALSDWILNLIERRRGALLPNRSLVFFLIILVLAVTSFQALQYLLRN